MEALRIGYVTGEGYAGGPALGTRLRRRQPGTASLGWFLSYFGPSRCTPSPIKLCFQQSPVRAFNRWSQNISRVPEGRRAFCNECASLEDWGWCTVFIWNYLLECRQTEVLDESLHFTYRWKPALRISALIKTQLPLKIVTQHETFQHWQWTAIRWPIRSLSFLQPECQQLHKQL